MKQYSLIEHWNDVSTWWHDIRYSSMVYPTDQEKQMIFFTAYERWLNDRPLLTVEDNYEWRVVPVPADQRWGRIT